MRNETWTLFLNIKVLYQILYVDAIIEKIGPESPENSLDYRLQADKCCIILSNNETDCEVF